jgi:hypothetical protein
VISPPLYDFARDRVNRCDRFGDDAAHCSNGLTAQKFRDATGEERAIYRRWMRGTIVTLFLIAGGMLLMNYSSASLTQFSSLSKSRATLARGANRRH